MSPSSVPMQLACGKQYSRACGARCVGAVLHFHFVSVVRTVLDALTYREVSPISNPFLPSSKAQLRVGLKTRKRQVQQTRGGYITSRTFCVPCTRLSCSPTSQVHVAGGRKTGRQLDEQEKYCAVFEYTRRLQKSIYLAAFASRRLRRPSIIHVTSSTYSSQSPSSLSSTAERHQYRQATIDRNPFCPPTSSSPKSA